MLKRFFHYIYQLTDFKNKTDSDTGGYAIAGRKKDKNGNPKQEDAIYISPETANGKLIIVADGLGGHAHGEFASNYIISSLKNAFLSQKEIIEDIPFFLRQRILEAAVMIKKKGDEDPEYHGTGTTLTGFLLLRNSFFTFNVGDSRVYKLDIAGKLKQLSKDHTPLQRMIEDGILSEKEARKHPMRNKMNSALGMPLDRVKIDIRGPLGLEKNEILLACSDGVHDYLTDEEIQPILNDYNGDAQLLAKSIVEAAYLAGSKDNISCCIFINV